MARTPYQARHSTSPAAESNRAAVDLDRAWLLLGAQMQRNNATAVAVAWHLLGIDDASEAA